MGCTESKPCLKPILRWVHSASCNAATAAKRPPTRADLVKFIEWAVERAEEEESRVGGGMAQSFLRAIVDDGKALLRRASPTENTGGAK